MSEERLSGGQLAAAISNAVVRAMADVSGRGPSRARATISRDAVYVLAEDALTRAEQELVRVGESEVVLRGRHGLQIAMHEKLDQEIERLTGRKVIGFMSTNHIDPDLAVEIFVLAPDGDGQRLAEGDSTA